MNQDKIHIEVLIDSPVWPETEAYWHERFLPILRQTLSHVHWEKESALTILLTDIERSQALNKEFRGIDKPTNVLSFPAYNPDELLETEDNYLGDLALCWSVLKAEAKEAHKSVNDHILHLSVHGLLHLLGYDHTTDKEAELMESLEIDIVEQCGIRNPYANNTSDVIKDVS